MKWKLGTLHDYDQDNLCLKTGVEKKTASPSHHCPPSDHFAAIPKQDGLQTAPKPVSNQKVEEKLSYIQKEDWEREQIY